jgi:hypothetical protein
LNTGLGFGILADYFHNNDTDNGSDTEFNSSIWLVPAVGALSGTLIGHLWLKDTKLTPQQGMWSAYAAAGGAVIGLGIALMTESDAPTPYYLIPYVTGFGAWAYVVERFRKKNSSAGLLSETHRSNFNFSLMPQNLFLNNKIQNKNMFVNGRPVGMQPLFAASLTF